MATMPEDDPGSLSRRKCADIAAFMLSANDYPPGAKDLDSGAEALNEIRLDPRKVKRRAARSHNQSAARRAL